jgi:hypothetical protein
MNVTPRGVDGSPAAEISKFADACISERFAPARLNIEARDHSCAPAIRDLSGI